MASSLNPASSSPSSAPWRTNAAYLESVDNVADLVVLLLRGFVEQDYSPLLFTAEPPVPRQLENAYVLLSTTARHRFCQALVHALAAWSPNAHPPAVAANLAYTAGLVRASLAIPLIGNTLKMLARQWQAAGHPTDEELWAGSTMIGVLHGFAAVPEAHTCLLQALDNQLLRTLFLNQLVVAACAASPDQWVRYLKLYFDAHENPNDPGSYDWPPSARHFSHSIARTVGLELLGSGFKLADEEFMRPFVELFLKPKGRIPLRFVSRKSGEQFFWSVYSKHKDDRAGVAVNFTTRARREFFLECHRDSLCSEPDELVNILQHGLLDMIATK